MQAASASAPPLGIAGAASSWKGSPLNAPQLSPTPHRTWAEIDLSALRHNVAAVRAHLGSRVRIMAIVKANAYGHGEVAVARALADSVEMLGVANLAEACRVRAAVPQLPIFILSPALPEERAGIAAQRFIPAVSDLEEAAAYSTLALGEPLEIHVKLDTGMGRMGVWQEEASALAAAIRGLPGVRITGLASHLPVADEDDAYTQTQLGRFAALVAQLRAEGLAAPIAHVENSAGVIGFPEQAGDLVRVGLMLYGSAPRPEFQQKLCAVMTWKTRVTLVRDLAPNRSVSYGRTFTSDRPMRVATLAVGYADGYQRHLSNRGADVLIHGQRCPVLGRVTMDQIVADVSALAEVRAGEEVVLLGSQGAQEIPVAELAEKAGTIAWEIFTSLGPRVAREYLP